MGRGPISRKKRYVTLEWPLSSSMWNFPTSFFSITVHSFNHSTSAHVKSMHRPYLCKLARLWTLSDVVKTYQYPLLLVYLLTVYTAAHQLRSSSDNSVLRRPSVRTVSYGQRSFSYSAPSAWNSLPQQVRSSDKVSTFRSRTKTHLFRLAY